MNPNGARGGNCRVDSPRCDMGLECSSGTPGTCREIITMMGAACDLAGRTSVCGTGLSCAPNAMLTAGTCAPVGTVAGAACRAVSRAISHAASSVASWATRRTIP